MPKTNCIVDLLVFGGVNFFSCSQWTREGTLHECQNVKRENQSQKIHRIKSLVHPSYWEVARTPGQVTPSTSGQLPSTLSEFGVILLWLITYPRINPWFGTIAFKGGTKNTQSRSNNKNHGEKSWWLCSKTVLEAVKIRLAISRAWKQFRNQKEKRFSTFKVFEVKWSKKKHLDQNLFLKNISNNTVDEWMMDVHGCPYTIGPMARLQYDHEIAIPNVTPYYSISYHSILAFYQICIYII